MKNSDKLFKELASRYVDIEGEKLKAEQLKDFDIPSLSDSLDKRVYRRIRRYRAKHYTAGWLSFAACMLIIIFAANFINNFAENPVQAPVTEEDTHNIIPLSVSLPENFNVSSYEQDREKTVYYIDNKLKDNVVLTLEKNTGLYASQGIVYEQSKTEYSIMVIAKDDLLYTMTCKFDYNTLVELSKGIL